VQQIVRELVGNGYVEKQKDGRRNRYRIVRSAHFRHPLESTVTLGDFLDLALRGAR
jgi:sugar-specific transcriptional regulator TrmB